MRKNILLISVVGIILMILVFIIAIPIKNDLIAKKVADDLEKIPLPNNSCFIEKKSLAGKLCGNGNGMQYFGAVLIKSDLSMEDIQDYYYSQSEDDLKYYIESQKDEIIRVIENQNASFESHIEGNDYYIVYAWGDYNGIASEFDLRGN
jgi:hypothetical protein